jgi:two-component system nitrogen regulation response regulator GlnG
LAQHFLAKSARERGETKQLDPLAYDHLRKFAWPGNVRQLENTLKRLVTTCPQEIIQASDVDSVLGPVQNARQIIGLGGGQKLSEAIASHLGRYFDLHGANLPPSGLYARILREMETPLIEIALEATAGNQAKCADLLGINRNTLRKKIGDLEIRVTRGRKLM